MAEIIKKRTGNNKAEWLSLKVSFRFDRLAEHHLLILDPECFEERHQRMLRTASLFRRLIRRRAAAV